MGLTPMMKQYLKIKENYEEEILFYRLGDFYEMFMEDAKTASSVLDITLTGRDGGLLERIPMCGIPYHAANVYIKKLIDNGFKVAICEQISDPKTSKGIVEREVVKVITPGTILDDLSLVGKMNNYIASLEIYGGYIALGISDVSTGEFKITALEVNEKNKIFDEINRNNVKELIVREPIKYKELLPDVFISKWLKHESCQEFYTFKDDIDGFECIKRASELLFSYILEVRKTSAIYIESIDFYQMGNFLYLDKQTRSNLELTESLQKGNRDNTLLQILDKTKSRIGARLLKKWIEQPLRNIEEIKFRLNCIEAFSNDLYLIDVVRKKIAKIKDFERILGRVVFKEGNGKDLINLKNSLKISIEILEILIEKNNQLYKDIIGDVPKVQDIIFLIEESIDEDVSVNLKDGNIIKEKYSKKVDECRDIIKNSKVMIAMIESKEREATGIKNLKVGYSKVFGYFIEVSKKNIDLVPDRYIRKQTISSGERYLLSELKDLEEKIINSEMKLYMLEMEIFKSINASVASYIEEIKKLSEIVSRIDVLINLAYVSNINGYSKPKITSDNIIEIIEARHPVVENILKSGEYVPNDFKADGESKFSVLTGPNMAGKSTYIRSVALIIIMAQIGSFVPCSHSVIGIRDRVFARVGASDDLAKGQSTFMMEMNEVSTILNEASKRSLVILDEVGRGTSTADGLSIAWAVSEYLIDQIGSATLFATHYHELIELAEKYKEVVNISVAVEEDNEKVVFTHRIIKGGASKSYGIHVAEKAGLPSSVILRAQDKLNDFESRKIGKENINNSAKEKIKNEKEDILLRKIREIKPDEYTPKEALGIIYLLKEMSENG